MSKLATIETTPFEYQVQQVWEGLKYLMDNHFDQEPQSWPRTASCKIGDKRPQILVHSPQEAMGLYEKHGLLDCYINAYPDNSVYTDFYLSRTGIAPTQVMIDQDLEHFKSMVELELAVTKTISNIKKYFGPEVQPTVMWTGNGFHTVLTQTAIVFERVPGLKEFIKPFEPSLSTKFLKFEEQFLSGGTADPCHNVSLNSCLLKIPNSLNSSQPDMDEATVKVVEPCSGGKPNAQKLYIPYYIWLQAGAIKDVQKMTDRCRKNWSTTKGDGRITWIEKLLQTVIDDNRYFCVWRVLIPYLINIRGLSRLDARDIILSWLDRCSSIRKLSFGLKKVDWSLSHPGTKPPIARLKLEGENPPLFKILKDKGVIY